MVLDHRFLRVQRDKGLLDDLRRKPVGCNGDAVLESLRAAAPLEGLELLAHGHHVGRELSRQLPRKQLCKFLMNRPSTVFGSHPCTKGRDEA